MPAKIARLILAFSTFPLLGAYSLRWTGGYATDLAALAGFSFGPLAFLDVAGAIAGLILGLLFAIQIAGCCLQPPASPVRPAGDTILIVLAVVLLADALLPRFLPKSGVLEWLPPLSLLAWAGCGAATVTLCRVRREFRMRAAK